VEENIDDVSSDQKESMAVPHAGPGIMLLTPSMRLLLLCFSKPVRRTLSHAAWSVTTRCPVLPIESFWEAV
jgi:hypothetical protein